MKQLKFSLSIITIFFISIWLISCDAGNDDAWNDGAKVNLPSYRAFILNEGNLKANNAHLTFLDPAMDTTYTKDIYEAQNGIRIGDTAEGMISYEGNIYYVVNYSRYIVRLSRSGVELARFSFGADTSLGKKLGEPRYVVAYDDKIYVTSYGGYVSKFNAETLAFEDSIKTDANPEQIAYYNGNLYWINSGFGTGKTMQIANVKTFGKAKPESVEIASNPYELQVDETVGKLYFMAYDTNYTSHVYSFDVKTMKYSKIGDATKMCAYKGNLYLANSVSPDWKNYATNLLVYHASNASTETWNLSNMPVAIKSKVVYMIACNNYDGSIYIATTDYVSNATVYHFGTNGSYIGNFSSRGINPNSMVFIK